MKRPRFKFRSLIMMALLLLPAGIKAQSYRMELGLLGGSSFYMGDANNSELFGNGHSSFGMLARYNLSNRFALKANAVFCGISGTTKGDASAYLNGSEVNFNRRILDAGAQLEMYFYNYGAPEYQPGASRISPYILLGFGFTGYETEQRKFCTNIPFGLGIKAKVSSRINLGCEWSFRKTSADDLDYDKTSTGFQLDNSWAGTGSWNKNKDWYSILMIYVSYDLYGIGSKCFK